MDILPCNGLVLSPNTNRAAIIRAHNILSIGTNNPINGINKGKTVNKNENQGIKEKIRCELT